MLNQSSNVDFIVEPLMCTSWCPIGYQGETKGKGATKEDVDKHLNGLFSLVQGLGGTAVVRTYIDQLAQVLSALVGWSKIVKCDKGGCDHGKQGSENCEYLKDKTPENKCDSCGCMKWKVKDPNNEGTPLGRKCTRCSDSGGSSTCKCSGTCSPGQQCQCALAGKCCKCYCKEDCKEKCKKDAKCICDKDIYISAYPKTTGSWAEGGYTITWAQLGDTTFDNDGAVNPSQRRHQCAHILLGSVCLIWSGLTYMYWTGKYAETSPRWNNHILDGSGLDDGTLSQWLQALGFPREMLNNSGPGNRLDAVIWDGFKEKFYLGFPDTSSDNGHGQDSWDNSFRNPAGMNFAGYIHTLEKGAFGDSVFKADKSVPDQNKLGPLYKLYILSCAYFTGLQKKTPPKADNKTPRTIREILYWLSALPYSQAYKQLLDYAKGRLTEVLKKPEDTASSSETEQPQLKFHQTGRWAPITVHEYNLFAHFQAVTQYCPLVLIGIQGGLHSPKGTDSHKEPPIHSLYANTECNFTYPTVSIQAYNQVVHYIRGLFYQLYFLRKQCAVKVAMGGKWRECRYGDGVVSKGVISWMCLGCNPMEHDRNYRVKEMGKMLDGVVQKVKASASNGVEHIETARNLLWMIGDVVVQLGNAQEALERRKGEEITKVKDALSKAKEGLERARKKLEEGEDLDETELEEAKKELEALTKSGSGALDTLVNGGTGSLQQVGSELQKWKKDYSSAKDRISEVINKVRDVLTVLEKGLPQVNGQLNGHKDEFTKAIKKLEDICNSPKCPPCNDHINKCGRQGVKRTCKTCHQQYMDGTPSPLQAFLEDRLPGFSCEVVRNTDTDKDTVYPPAASHLGHCGGSGQCCPLPMGFRGQFHSGIRDCTGKRLYGLLYFFSNENMMQSCVYTLVRVTAELSATTPQVLGDVFGFFRGGVGNKEQGEGEKKGQTCSHDKDPSKEKDIYFCGWCASGLRDEVRKIEWIPFDGKPGGQYMDKVGKALIQIKGDKGTGTTAYSSAGTTTSALSTLTDSNHYVSPLTGELYTAVSATFGGTYLSWVLYLSDALEGGLKSLSEAFQQIECNACKGQCDPNKCKKGEHGQKSNPQDAKSTPLCQCQSIVSCTGVLPVLYRHGFGYGNPFNLEGYRQGDGTEKGDYSIQKEDKSIKHCHEFLESLSKVLVDKKDTTQTHPLTNLLKQVGQLQYDIRLPWIFVLTLAWLVAVLYLAFGAIWPLDWTHMRSHWLRGGEHQWEAMWYKVMTGRKGMELVEYFGKT
ncbi:variant erythrocyte surface antigen-1 alpha subunit [Babesia bovis T2Bo]|uniref:Variant erythrocyte surface antigen-1, alpha subunit n=1 Tax=Babesia bovis TaxID=5865 RepID=A7ATC1_BABBO|nr:variant erythrocyte surface antigen-1 alpha subunit [Babesia bovis T2Bo]EDO06182.1 variant erythrocyte surface antigen-1 alpha subunit [Babesia bovis T2Bo]|eukprot:XP_001609750.1 variant erythrocyte surface antigen-1, alpha subunit [Babesia bovis T2Bo]